MKVSRAPLSREFSELLPRLRPLLKELEFAPHIYGSIYVERKVGNGYVADFKKTSLTDHATAGAVLRIYDGSSLFEQATDDLSIDSLTRQARHLADRVRALKQPNARPYTPPSWAARLTAELEADLRSQIPAQLTPETHVHFGVRFKEDLVGFGAEQAFVRLQEILAKIKRFGKAAGFGDTELSYGLTRLMADREESLFVDRETTMSQSLYRVALLVAAMSGGHRCYVRNGGLAGLEGAVVSDEEIRETLEDLRGITKAERLAPGKYRVLFSPALSGVLAHEAFGHSQEGDTCARGRSKAWPLHLEGKRVGNSMATILNNPAIFENADTGLGAWGSYYFDEEGWLAQEQVLLAEGKLLPPMTNLTSALRLGVPRSANGKRESFANGVYTRQTNTYFSAGKSTYQELLGQIQDGFVATHAAGGMEDPKGMGIQVGIGFLKEVKNGKLTGRVFRGAAGGDIQMTGYTPDVLEKIIGKSKIEAMSSSPDQSRHPMNDVGGCGKYHKEFVNAGCGGPYLLLDGVTLG